MFLPINRFKKIWDKFKKYAFKHNAFIFTDYLGQSFIREKYNHLKNDKPKEFNKKLRAIQILSDFHTGKPMQKMKRFRNYEPPEIFNDIFHKYFVNLEKDISSWHSIRNNKSEIISFMNFIIKNKINKFSDINSLIIIEYLKTKSNLANSTKSKVFSELRLFLKYAYEQKILSKDLAIVIPTIQYNKKSNIPSAFTKDEVLRILEVIDRKTPIGKRDYSIILLASKLGICSCDICSLTLENLNWLTNQIIFKQSKTGNIIKLPITIEIGEAIIDYLKNGRPDCRNQYIFVRHYAPFDYLTNGATYEILNKYIKMAQIDLPEGKRHGLHSLRHSLASELLQQNISLPVISEVLGHSNTEITNVYLKINIKQLQKCALEVPYVN